MTTHPRCGTVVYMTRPPTSHLYKTCGVSVVLLVCGLARAGAIAAAMHSAAIMAINFMCPSATASYCRASRNLRAKAGASPCGGSQPDTFLDDHAHRHLRYADGRLQLNADVCDRVGPLRRHLQQRQTNCAADANHELVACLSAL